MGKYQFKLNLLEDIRTIDLNKTTKHGKSYSIDINEGTTMYLFDKDFNLLKEWYDSLIKARQRCEMVRQEQEIKFRKEKQQQQQQRKEVMSDQIERKNLILNNNENKRESLLDKFSEKYLDKPFNNSAGKLNRTEDDNALEYLNNLRQRLTGATSVTELNRSASNLAQVKANTPIINRKRSLQRKSLLSQFDSFLGSSLSHSSSKQQIHQPNLDNLTNLANLANLTSGASSNNNNPNLENSNKLIEGIESPTMLPRIAPQCQAGQPNLQNNKQLTNSCSVFQFNHTNNSPFSINNSPALTQRSLYAERILSNSSLTLSNLSKFSNAKNSTLSTGFSSSLFKPFRESIHYATSLRKDNLDGGKSHLKSHLKSATSEFSFIRLTNNSSTLTKSNHQKVDDSTLKRQNRNNKSNFNRMHSFANGFSDSLDSEKEISISNSTNTDHDSDTLRNELKNSKTITNLNSEISNRAIILNSNDIGLGHLNNNLMNNQIANNQFNHSNPHYQKMKKINNSLDESDSTFSSSNSSCSSNNYSSINSKSNQQNQLNNLKRPQDILSYSPNLANSQSPRPLINSPKITKSPNFNHHANNNSICISNSPLINSPLLNQQQKNMKKNPSTKSTVNQNDKDHLYDHTYQKVNSKRVTNKQSTNKGSTNKTPSANSRPSQKKKNTSLIPVSNSSYGKIINEQIYQSAEKRKIRMNKILEKQSKIYVTMSDLK